MRRILISAGDASGDLHAAGLVDSLRERMPDLQIVGLGGELMRRAGVEILADQSDLAIGGLLELAGSVSRIARVWRRMSTALRTESFDLVILVDSGGFNLPLARRVRRVQKVPVLYYVAPQVWAWRPGRKHKLAARVDRLMVIHPFETEVWQGSGLQVDFVGHPLVDELESYRMETSVDEARGELALRGEGPWIALLPGSRRNEVQQHLPIQLAAARELHSRIPDCGFLLASAPSIESAQVEAILDRSNLPVSLRIERVEDNTRAALRAADVALAKPGTVTLEAMLLETPMVVMGRAHPVTAAILKRALKVPWLAMPNLLAGRGIVPEYLQEQALPAPLADALERLLRGPDRSDQLEAFERVRTSLGHNATATACGIVEEMLDVTAA